MKHLTFPVNDFQENCYLVWDQDSREAALIDCGATTQAEWAAISRQIEELGLTLKHNLLTHCHFDHIMGLPFVRATYGLKPQFHKIEQPVYDAMPQMAARFGITMPQPLPQPQAYLGDGDQIHLGNGTLKVIHTPGHTWGGLCYYDEAEDKLFSGDTLFRESLGRTDLGGDMDEEINSIRTRILTLPPHTAVHPGHGPSTTVEWEMAHNPFVRTRR